MGNGKWDMGNGERDFVAKSEREETTCDIEMYRNVALNFVWDGKNGSGLG